MLDAISVTLIGVDVCSARYCKALKLPTPRSPSHAKYDQRVRNPPVGRITRHPSGSRMTNASNQRLALRSSGEIEPTDIRATTVLPAQSKGGSNNIAIDRAESRVMAP